MKLTKKNFLPKQFGHWMNKLNAKCIYFSIHNLRKIKTDKTKFIKNQNFCFQINLKNYNDVYFDLIGVKNLETKFTSLSINLVFRKNEELNSIFYSNFVPTKNLNFSKLKTYIKTTADNSFLNLDNEENHNNLVTKFELKGKDLVIEYLHLGVNKTYILNKQNYEIPRMREVKDFRGDSFVLFKIKRAFPELDNVSLDCSFVIEFGCSKTSLFRFSEEIMNIYEEFLKVNTNKIL